MTQEKYIEKIRTKYGDKKVTDLEALKALDARVSRPATVFAYIYGSISAVVMGCGMSLCMTDIGAYVGLADAMIPGIIIGCAGMLLALLTYPIYKGIMKSRKKKYAGRIIELSEKILNK